MNTWSPPWVEGHTIGDVLRRAAGKFGARDCLIFPQQDYRASYAEFDRQVDAAACGLLAMGIRRGDHFAVWATNWPRWVILQFATARIGCVLAPINPAFRESELAYVLRQSDVRGLALIERFHRSDYFDILAQVCPELTADPPGELHCEQAPRLRYVVSLSDRKRPGMIGWKEFLERGAAVSAEAFTRAQSQPSPRDAVNIQYTSGTTGLPKGAVLTHRSLLLNAYYAGEHQRITERDRICIPVPLYHCFGCVLGTLMAVIRGAAMIFPHEKFRPRETLDSIERYGCTAIYGVPTMFIAQFEDQSFAGRDLSSLRTGIMAGSPCPIELMKRVISEMGAGEITICYGQTEASPLVTQTRTDDSIDLRVGTVGRELPGVELKIVDCLSGQDLADGESGELWARGHCVMRGYYNMPEETAAAIDADGWLHTGDLAMRQPNGYYRITGRLKDVIIRGGENISPREIEEFLYRRPEIEDVQVVGVPDKKFGEEVFVWIRLRAGQSATEAEIREYCRSSLAHFKTPRYVRFVDEFPMTATGKVQKYKLRQRAVKELKREEIARMETA